MFGIGFLTALGNPLRSRGARSRAAATAAPRRIALLRSGRRHGAITRLITPWDIGELTQPFVFLDYAELAPGPQPGFGLHRYPGIATLTLVLNGVLAHANTAGKRGEVPPGGFEWVRAGTGPWHEGASASGEPLRIFRLSVALPPSPKNSSVESESIAPQQVEEDGPVRVVLGRFGHARSPLRSAPPDINVFQVRLGDGQRWRYVAPDGHNVTWLAVDRGGLQLQEGERVYWEQIAVFGDSGGVIEAQADGDTSFVVGSARRRPGPFVPSEYSLPTGPTGRTPCQPVSQHIAARLRAPARA
jgi:redox-sensitive bicupin YhaK (pirin superfamily)